VVVDVVVGRERRSAMVREQVSSACRTWNEKYGGEEEEDVFPMTCQRCKDVPTNEGERRRCAEKVMEPLKSCR
jgi:hypothetical protein